MWHPGCSYRDRTIVKKFTSHEDPNQYEQYGTPFKF